MKLKIEFRECPKCNGYGVLDNGNNCRECGGRGRGGLLGDGVIGSGEIMFDSKTGARITNEQLANFLRQTNSEEIANGN